MKTESRKLRNQILVTDAELRKICRQHGWKHDYPDWFPHDVLLKLLEYYKGSSWLQATKPLERRKNRGLRSR